MRSARIAAASTVSPSSHDEGVIAGLYGNLERHLRRLRSRVFARASFNLIRVLLIGCGDVAPARRANDAQPGPGSIGIVRRAEEIPRLRAHGVVPIVADLDDFASLRRLALAPFAVLHCAPPPSEGRDDPRTRKLVAALTRARIIPQRFVYLSTSGVYGDCAGARVDETRPRKPQTPRARRRVAAEDRLRAWGGRNGVALAILRVAGHLLRCAAAARAPQAGHARARARRRRVHQPHPRRRPRARGGCGDLPRQHQPRVQRHRRRRDEDGRVVRRRRGRVPPAAPAARDVGRGRAAHRADAAVVHERIAPARQRARQARAAPAPRAIRRRSRCSRRSRRASFASSSPLQL